MKIAQLALFSVSVFSCSLLLASPSSVRITYDLKQELQSEKFKTGTTTSERVLTIDLSRNRYRDDVVTIIKRGMTETRTRQISFSDGKRLYRLDSFAENEATYTDIEPTDRPWEASDISDRARKIGTETVAGKVCDVEEMDHPGYKSKRWTWNGFVLKEQTEVKGLISDLTARTVEENVPVPDSLFSVPSDYTVMSQNEWREKREKALEASGVRKRSPALAKPVRITFDAVQNTLTGGRTHQTRIERILTVDPERNRFREETLAKSSYGNTETTMKKLSFSDGTNVYDSDYVSDVRFIKRKANSYHRPWETHEVGQTEVGEEVIAGRKCKVFARDRGGSGIKSKTWIWNRIALKETSSFQDFESSSEARVVNEDVPVPDSLFTLPSNAEVITEKDLQANARKNAPPQQTLGGPDKLFRVIIGEKTHANGIAGFIYIGHENVQGAKSAIRVNEGGEWIYSEASRPGLYDREIARGQIAADGTIKGFAMTLAGANFVVWKSGDIEAYCGDKVLTSQPARP